MRRRADFLLKCFSASQQTPGLLNSSTGLQPHEKRGPPLAPVKIHRVLNIGSAAWPSLGWCFLPLSSDFVLIIFFALVLMKSLLGVLRFQVHWWWLTQGRCYSFLGKASRPHHSECPWEARSSSHSDCFCLCPSGSFQGDGVGPNGQWREDTHAGSNSDLKATGCEPNIEINIWN